MVGCVGFSILTFDGNEGVYGDFISEVKFLDIGDNFYEAGVNFKFSFEASDK